MGAKVSFNATTRIIQITQAPVGGEIDIDVKIDLYSDGKEDWITDSNLTKAYFPIRSVGGDPLPGEKALGATFFLDPAWKIRPYEGTHVLNVNGNLYSEDGSSPFTPTIGAYNVTIISAVSSLVDSTIQQLAEIQYMAFNSGVCIDAIGGAAGTEYPLGTQEYPVDNVADAVSIAATRGLNILRFIGDYTFLATDNIDGFRLFGQDPKLSTLTLTEGLSTEGCIFENCTIQGTLDGDTSLRNCRVLDLDYIEGQVENCIFLGDISITGSNTPVFKNCIDGWADGYIPSIDMGGSGRNLVLANYTGDIKITNLTGSQYVSLDLNSGKAWLDSSITAGYIFIRGLCSVSDQSSGTTIDLAGTLNIATIQEALCQGNISMEIVPATEQDNVRNVAVGKPDRIIKRYKRDGESDWSSAYRTDTLYCWYQTLGSNVILELKEDG